MTNLYFIVVNCVHPFSELLMDCGWNKNHITLPNQYDKSVKIKNMYELMDSLYQQCFNVHA